MASNSVNVRITGTLREHVQEQISGNGLYESASEYIRDLIRRDFTEKQNAWKFLEDELESALNADESEYLEVSAEDVIQRNKSSQN